MELVQIYINFLKSNYSYCIFSVVIYPFSLLDPGGKMNADPCGSGSTSLARHYMINNKRAIFQ